MTDYELPCRGKEAVRDVRPKVEHRPLGLTKVETVKKQFYVEPEGRPYRHAPEHVDPYSGLAKNEGDSDIRITRNVEGAEGYK